MAVSASYRYSQVPSRCWLRTNHSTLSPAADRRDATVTDGQRSGGASTPTITAQAVTEASTARPTRRPTVAGLLLTPSLPAAGHGSGQILPGDHACTSTASADHRRAGSIVWSVSAA